jgi:hypothetical protein
MFLAANGFSSQFSYALHDGLSLDARFIVGHFGASPRVGVQIGFSRDINPEPPNQPSA